MSNVHVLKLASYEPPVIEESKKNEWVTYGENNSYYTFLMERYKNSTTNNAIINNISRLIYGKGLSATDANKKPNEYAQMKAMINAEDLRKVVLDFEMLGQAAFQVHYTADRKKVQKLYHIPVHLLAPEKCNKDGEIEAYYYSNNWEDTRNYTPERIPAFGFGNEKVEILMVQPYSVGMKYFSYVDYQGGIPYAVLEEEISNYLINEVQRGFSGRIVVNFNNGVPTPEEQDIIKSKVLSQLSGTDGHKIIVAFNNNSESKTTVDAMPVNDAPDLYNQLSEECMRKIMLSHNVTSPLLFGIATTTGFSSNADELRNSAVLFENMVIKPKQEIILKSIDTILAYNGVALDLEFIGLNPLDSEGDLTTGESATRVIEGINSLSPLVANKVLESMTPNEIRALVGLPPEQGGSDLAPSVTELSSEATDEELDVLLNDLEGEVLGDEWERVTEREVKSDNISTEEWVNNALNPKKSVLAKLASIIKSEPSRESNLDKSVYKVRYEYSERYSKPNSRDFCVKMMSRTASGVVYRLEDIDKASRAGVNKELGHKGQSYDLFKFKGGVNCSHYWKEVLYKLKQKDGKYVEDKSLNSSEEVSSIPKSYQPRPTGNAQSKVAPIDMPNNGHHPNYGK